MGNKENLKTSISEDAKYLEYLDSLNEDQFNEEIDNMYDDCVYYNMCADCPHKFYEYEHFDCALQCINYYKDHCNDIKIIEDQYMSNKAVVEKNIQTAFKGDYIKNEDPEAVENLFKMMLAARKQINIRKAVKNNTEE